MNKIKVFFVDLFTEIELADFAKKAAFAAGLIFFLTTILNIGSMLYETRAPKGIIYAKDNDAGRGVQTATLTRWWNSNHFAPYGNLYFRFAHTLANVTPGDISPKLNPEEQVEARHHFALLTTSLLFLSSLCLFLAFLISGKWALSFFLASVLLRLGTYDVTWVEYLFRVHPDHTLMFFCAVSSYFTLRYTNTGSHKDFVKAAILWGIATAVKRATVLFIPSFLFLFASEGLNKESLKKGSQFVGYMLLSYLIIGFPQNFGFYKHIHFMLVESHNSLPPTQDSIVKYLSLIFNQSIYIWTALLAAHFFIGKREYLLNKRYVIFCAISLLVVLAGRMSTRSEHHIMPHVAVYFILAIYAIKYLPVLNWKYTSILFGIISTVALILLPSNTALSERKEHQLDCRKEIESVLELASSLQGNSGKLIRDPYFPFTSSKKELTDQIWGVNGEILDKENALLWGTQKDHLKWLSKKPYRPYIYPDLTLEQWNAKTDLARRAQTETSFVTPSGKTFEKIYDDRCGYMLWKRKE